MAYTDNKYCPDCKEMRPHTNGNCDVCKNKQQEVALDTWLAQTDKDKLLDLHKRILRLETTRHLF